MSHAAAPSVRLRRASHLRVCSCRPRSATAKMAVVKTWRGLCKGCRLVLVRVSWGPGDAPRPVVRVPQRALGCKGVRPRSRPRLRLGAGARSAWARGARCGARGCGAAARGCATLYVAEVAQPYCVRVSSWRNYTCRGDPMLWCRGDPMLWCRGDLHLGDDGEGGGVDVGEGQEAKQVHDEVDHCGHRHLQ